MKNINEFSDGSATNFLIEEHSMGWVRSEGDLINSIYHSRVTLNFLKDILSNIDGSIEEKVKFVDNAYKNLDIVENNLKQNKIKKQRLDKLKMISNAK